MDTILAIIRSFTQLYDENENPFEVYDFGESKSKGKPYFVLKYAISKILDDLIHTDDQSVGYSEESVSRQMSNMTLAKIKKEEQYNKFFQEISTPEYGIFFEKKLYKAIKDVLSGRLLELKAYIRELNEELESIQHNEQMRLNTINGKRSEVYTKITVDQQLLQTQLTTSTANTILDLERLYGKNTLNEIHLGIRAFVGVESGIYSISLAEDVFNMTLLEDNKELFIRDIVGSNIKYVSPSSETLYVIVPLVITINSREVDLIAAKAKEDVGSHQVKEFAQFAPFNIISIETQIGYLKKLISTNDVNIPFTAAVVIEVPVKTLISELNKLGSSKEKVIVTGAFISIILFQTVQRAFLEKCINNSDPKNKKQLLGAFRVIYDDTEINQSLNEKIIKEWIRRYGQYSTLQDKMKESVQLNMRNRSTKK
jgi:hypothetical protein